jgi:hypothetical protein
MACVFSKFNTEDCGWGDGACKELMGIAMNILSAMVFVTVESMYNTEGCGWDEGDYDKMK